MNTEPAAIDPANQTRIISRSNCTHGLERPGQEP